MEIDFESTMEHIVDSIRTAGYELSDLIVDKWNRAAAITLGGVMAAALFVYTISLLS